MRRPAQPPSRPAAWAHPYQGVAALAVFYNSGGATDPSTPPTPAAPTPADLAARTTPQPPTTPQTPPAPLTQRISPDNSDVLIDRETGQPMTQGKLSQLMTKQFEKSRRSAYREMAEAAGVPFDPDNFDPQSFGQLLKDAQAARQQALTEEQRRAEELERQQQTLQSEQTKLQQERAQLVEEKRALAREQALTRLGAVDVRDEQGQVTAPNLQDALAMLERDLRDTPDADTATLTAAAEALKKRRPELFGASPAPQTLPPAPSGGPAGGNAPRQPVGGKDALREEARRRAERMGLRSSDAA